MKRLLLQIMSSRKCHAIETYAFSVAIPMKVFLSLSLQNLEVDHLLRCCFTLAGVEVT